MERVCAAEESQERKNNTEECEKNAPGRSTGVVVNDNKAEARDEQVDEDQDHLKLLCWNVDGLDGEKQPERARGLCSYLNSHSPDVVFLQELIQPYVRFLKKRLAADYTFIEAGKEHYFTGMMLKKSRITLLDSEIVSYPTTEMLRNLLIAQVLFKGQKLYLMTSHFESCKDSAEERMRQLRLVMQRIREAPDDVIVLFGGDTNLRDYEVAKVGLPSSVNDVWEQLGEPESCHYTWDTQTNTNKGIRFKCRLRFDRIYLRQATSDGALRLDPDHMSLTGLEMLDCGTTAHSRLYCDLSVLENITLLSFTYLCEAVRGIGLFSILSASFVSSYYSNHYERCSADFCAFFLYPMILLLHYKIKYRQFNQIFVKYKIYL